MRNTVFNLSRNLFFIFLTLLLASFIPSVYKFYPATGKIDTLSRSAFKYEWKLSDSLYTFSDSISFPNSFSQLEGVSTFRGGPYRDRPSYGLLDTIPKSLTVKWSYSTGWDSKWGGGAGWTGQACIIKWSDSIRTLMNVADQFKTDSAFKEVILGSLDGKIYFLDLETGQESRPAINIKNPIKGSVSVDPRGWPILYAGQGISNSGEFGIRIFSLIDQSRTYFLNGKDPFAHRLWSAFDSSPLIYGAKDIMFVGGENGLIYSVNLNTKINSTVPGLNATPSILKMRFKGPTVQYQGIESSLIGYNDKLYLSDNHGLIQCLSADSLKPIWITRNHDDTDATLVLEEESPGSPFIYTGCEVDLQGDKGFTYLKKLNGLNGAVVWEQKFACQTVKGEHPVNGGMLSTPIVGKNKGDSLVVFSLSRYGGLNKGLLVALKKDTGEKAWEYQLDNYAWSSPLDIYDKAGNMFVFLADSKGFVLLFDGVTGALIYKEKIADIFEASPAAFGNKIVIASRPRKIFCLEVN
jgi:outer membrane protein assembly factor BamB